MRKASDAEIGWEDVERIKSRRSELFEFNF